MLTEVKVLFIYNFIISLLNVLYLFIITFNLIFTLNMNFIMIIKKLSLASADSTTHHKQELFLKSF